MKGVGEGVMDASLNLSSSLTGIAGTVTGDNNVGVTLTAVVTLK